MTKGPSQKQRNPNPTPSQKRSLPPPTTLSDFIVALILHFCRKYVLFNIDLKIGVYCLIVLFGSFVRDIAPLPRVYISQKSNVFNVFFVKWCWAWTLVLIGAFVYYSSNVYSAGDIRNIRQQIARLIVGTFVWFFNTTLFVYVMKSTGYCTKSSTSATEVICTSSGGRWIALDISGHVFMLIYICLLNSEELRVFRNWDQIKVLVDAAQSKDTDPPQLMLLTKPEIDRIRSLYVRYTPTVRVLFVLSTILNLIWEFMLVISTLYYHRPAEKLVAALLAVFCWWITYRVWFRSEFSPGLPGHCKLKYIKDRDRS